MSTAEQTLSLTFAEGLYDQYLRDPASVAEDWRAYFENLQQQDAAPAPRRLGPSFQRESIFHNAGGNGRPRDSRDALDAAHLQHLVDQLIRNFRVRGHISAQLDPLGLPRPEPDELSPAFYGLTDDHLDHNVSTSSMPGPRVQTVRQVLQRLRNTYCRAIGVQFMHIDDLKTRQWLQERMEGSENRILLSAPQQRRILKRLTDAVVFETFIQKKYVGAKSFSLEGAETLIPLLDLAIEKADTQGVRAIVMAMAHRGRLNVLANILGKEPCEIFREFEDADPARYAGGGDVKYHLGYSSDWTAASGRKLHLSLCFNPSHLEFINPVALGRVRARQDQHHDTRRERSMAILVHGDAAFAGEGIVQETLNLNRLASYATGGTLHVIVNNQIGFTTPPEQGRSSVYATDVARLLQIPIFHVNGEDPEAVAQVVDLAMDFRRQFKSDVIIDMYCYRRRGHNEGDEPAFTQPLLYKAIRSRPSVGEAYLQRLENLGEITSAHADAFVDQKTAELEAEHARATDPACPVCGKPANRGAWTRYYGGPEDAAPDTATGVDAAQLKSILLRLSQVPEGFQPHRKIERVLAGRREMADGQRPLDWAAAEGLAFATLALAGHRVRLSGQDAQRGTFSHRHAVLHDAETGKTHHSYQHLAPDQAPIDICNSPLSETGVLGFDYGYSLDTPDGLVCWEAQFGDFVNVAQTIIDQFIASAEAKWQRLSGLTLLLPHGFEGQGPEHSSGRLERFLMLGARDNIQVIYPTTPAQIFHALRRQVVRPLRKPLIVMTPKSLLRHPEVVSPLDDLAAGNFKRVIGDPLLVKGNNIQRVLLCAGKVYYDLLEKRRQLQRDDTAIVRMEQLYPLPQRQLQAALQHVADGTRVLWVQEEPRNMGAWPYLRLHIGCDQLFDRLPFTGVYRPESASPATGSHNAHKREQELLLNQAFGLA